ncbi:MAG: hypothetical protein HZA77_07855 [Candidatus Schekmanbacteria bacterium]|nr:hypothetical protein [Candidatus Schekmanbacteria bacterium]
MADFNWQQNSKAMFDKSIEGSPKPFQEMTRKRLLETLTKKAGDGGAVTEDMFLEAVKEITPKPFLQMALKALEGLKTK